MREDDDHIRQFAPVLRRIIIMVAVLTAIPVAMWTITAFVRTYVGPPHAPNYQPTKLPSVTSDEAQAAPVETASAPSAADPTASASVIVARATTTDVDSSPLPGDPTTAQPPVTGAAAMPVAASATPTPMAATPAPGPATNQKPAPATVVAAQQPAPTNWPAQTNWPAAQPSTDEALPAGDPIAGNVPLPRKRPHSFVVAQSTVIPLPRPRPDAAGPGAVAASPTPLQWIHNILRPSSSETPAPQATPGDTDDSYVQTPH